MSDDATQDPADYLYSEGKKYDWQQDESLAAATLARANFQQAASMGHRGAVRALAHLIYEGRGGPQDKERALLLLWSAFNRGDLDALEELADLLASYAEQLQNLPESSAATEIAETIANLDLALSKVSSYMHKIARARLQQADKS